ncbi:MAG: hypothetical protein GXO94_09260 [Nitrospirae bacterium]|nr:hypothetical protein [Nitrospirota bacterium]
MDRIFDYRTYLARDGQSRKQRFPKALDPFFARIDDRTRKDLLRFASEYSKLINYFDPVTNKPSGDWEDFFKAIDDEEITRLKGYAKHEPHIALYLAFILLFRHAQKQINGLTRRHLDFYYRDVLGFEKRPAVPDTVHVLFELKKNADEQLVEAGTLLKAGKDGKGSDLFYALTSDTVVNKAEITGLCSVFVDDGGVIHAAPQADSSDGLGGELDRDEPMWYAFGNSAMPKAEVGFAVASPILLLNGGKRTVTLSLEFSDITGQVPDPTDLERLSVFLTGKKGWTGPKAVSVESGTGTKMKLTLVLESDDEAVVSYDPAVHGGDFGTSYPLMKFVLDTGEENVYPSLANAVLGSIKIDVVVEGTGGLNLESDTGSIDASKPFLPFGPIPETGSGLYIGCEEAFGKRLDSLSINISWRVPADDFSDYYAEYDTSVSNDYFRARLLAPDRSTELNPDTALFNSLDASNEAVITAEVSGHTPFKGDFIVLELITDFLHREYRQVYTEKVLQYTSSTESSSGGLPNEPYTPVIQSLTLDYSSSTEEVDLASDEEADYTGSEIEFFHVTALGQAREHGFLKKGLDFVTDKNVYLLPQYRHEGEFYIGVKNIRPLQELSILFQVAEGSSNPDKEKVSVSWSILSDNHWRDLSASEIASDSTNGLLRSGIIRFRIPREATDSGTVLPGGSYWLRAAVKEDTDAVCRLVDVRPNAAAAVFTDRDNDPSHLREPLKAGTIGKLAEPVSTIKGIEQPYASFGGRMAEDDRSFYTRVSERLRHKDRALTLWDYERIVLEEFPSLYKVKCLNHTSPDSFHAPGHVTVVVVPDLRNRNAVNPLEPRADKNTLSEVEKLLRDHTGPFVKLHVENPAYEQVRLEFKVGLRSDYEFGYYSRMLEEEIKKFLSPWAFGEGMDIMFGGLIHKSVILNFIEGLTYVDFVTDFRMYHVIGDKESPDTDTVAASSPKAILVSAPGHRIEVAQC